MVHGFDNTAPDQILVLGFGLSTVGLCAPKTMGKQEIVRRINNKLPADEQFPWRTWHAKVDWPKPCPEDDSRQHWQLHS